MIYYSDEKVSYDDAVEELMPLILDATDETFFVKKGGDNSGASIDVYAETIDTSISPWVQKLPAKFLGWRVIMLQCPRGFIDAILRVTPKK